MEEGSDLINAELCRSLEAILNSSQKRRSNVRREGRWVVISRENYEEIKQAGELCKLFIYFAAINDCSEIYFKFENGFALSVVRPKNGINRIVLPVKNIQPEIHNFLEDGLCEVYSESIKDLVEGGRVP